MSCYGYTSKLAQKVYEGAKSSGKYDVELKDISEEQPGVALEKIVCADAFALGSPTLNRDALPPIWDVMTCLCPYIMKGRPAAVFGTFGWSGEACGYMEQRLSNLGIKVQGQARAKMNPSEDDLKAAYDLGVKLADALD